MVKGFLFSSPNSLFVEDPHFRDFKVEFSVNCKSKRNMDMSIIPFCLDGLTLFREYDTFFALSEEEVIK